MAGDRVQYFIPAWPQPALIMWAKCRRLDWIQNSSFTWARCCFTFFFPVIHIHTNCYFTYTFKSISLFNFTIFLTYFFKSFWAYISKYYTTFLWFSSNKIENHGNCQPILVHCCTKSVGSSQANTKFSWMPCNY